MDLRTKLVFALVSVSLISMAALGTLAYTESSVIIRANLLRQLDALAESRKQDLEHVMRGWGDRVRLVGSHTDLRLGLAAYGSEPEANRVRIAGILEDASASVPVVRSLSVYDREGRLVASVPAGSDPSLPPEAADIEPGEEDPTFLGLRGGPEAAHARYLMPLTLEGTGLVGWLEARLAADELTLMAADTTGLGPTGETLVVARRGDSYRALHPTRDAPAEEADPLGMAASPGSASGAIDPADLAVRGIETTIGEGAVDYRGEPVWAATRYLDDLGWGVVVKVDAAQEIRTISTFGRRLFRGALAFGAFAILAGILLGLHLSRPIQDLVQVANRLREGDADARAKVYHRDEIGMLARTFNRMADALTGVSVELRTQGGAGGGETGREAPGERKPEPPEEASA